MIEQQRERIDHRARPALEQRRRSRLEPRSDRDEIAIEHARLAGRRIEQLHEALGDLRAKPLDDRRRAVIALHELLDREIFLVLVLVAELGCERALVVEQQAFLGASGGEVQRIAISAQRRFRSIERGALGRIEHALRDHRVEIRRARDAPAEPAQQIERAQAAGPVLEIRLEVVRRVVEARVAIGLLGALGGEIRRRRPEPGFVDEPRERFGERRRAGETPRIEQVREYRDIDRGKLAAIAELAHRVARLEADIPQAREERLDHVRVPLQRAGLDQHEQVDVGMREQESAAETADREQRHVGRIADARAPDMHDDVLDRLRADARQCARVGAVAECVGELAFVVAEQLAQCEARFGGDAAARHRRRQARCIRKARG